MRERERETEPEKDTERDSNSRVEGLPGRVPLGGAPSEPREAPAEVAPEVVVVGSGAVFGGVVDFFFRVARGSRAREVEKRAFAFNG